MKRNRLFLCAFALGMLGISPAFAQDQTVTMVTAKAVDSPMTLMVNQTSAGVTVDWGDGNPVAYPATAEDLCTITGTVKGTTIKLTGSRKLSTLVCAGNELTSITLTGAPNLRSLYCQDNKLTSLNVDACTELTDLDCANNSLTRVILTADKFPALQNVNISGNRITTVTGSSGRFSITSAELQHANIANNKFSTVLLTGNSNLDQLRCEGNPSLKSIDLSPAPEVSLVTCYNNSLTTLSAKSDSLPELRHLYCDNNKLTKLPLAYSSKLTELSCANNQISQIDFSVSKPNSIVCNNNKLAFNALPNAKYKPANMVYAPQAMVDISSALQLKDNKYYYVVKCPSYSDRTKPQYQLDLSEWFQDGNGNYTGIAFTAWKFDNEAGQYTEMSLASTSAKTNEYWIGSATSASLRGRMIFLQPQESVRIQMTSTTYPDLVLTTNAFAVGEENATGIDKVVNEAGNELQIIPGRGELTLRANGQTRAAVFTIDGKQVWNGSVQNGEKTIRLNRGIYVVNGKKVVL